MNKYLPSTTRSFLTLTLGIAVAGFFLVTPAQAANTADFKAGRIIDDQVFFDPNGLSIQEIQSFLNSKVPTCDTWGTQPHGGTTRADYGKSRGYPPPYTCIKDYLQQTNSKPQDSYCKGHPMVYKKASELIHSVAHSCGINPRVLIVLLQKEQGLITDDWPWSLQYRGATGYGCPDTAACDSEYYGFFNQLYYAARQFKMYAQNNSSYVYRAYRDNYIQWNPNSSCGGSTVYIENLATSGLYNYTPYRPNQAALNAGYGTGDNCSAYGNRNFWLYYTDWFGSTFTPNYWWNPVSQTVFKDQTKSSTASSRIVAGERRYLQVKVKNTGAAAWQRGQIKLATSAPGDRQSAFYDSTWLSPNRTATLVESSVAPGSTGTFEFWITATSPGSFKEYFTLVNDGVTWFNDHGLHFSLEVEPQRYTWSVVTQQAFYDQARTKVMPWSIDTVSDETIYGKIVAKNTGNITWRNSGSHPVRLGSGSTDFCAADWFSTCTRATTLKESSVEPGQNGTFEFTLRMPKNGDYKLGFNLVAENKRWFSDPGLYYPVKVSDPRYTWSISKQTAYADAALTQPLPYTIEMQNGQTVYLALEVKNTSNFKWGSAVKLATAKPRDRSSTFHDSAWLSTNRLASFKETSPVLPEGTATFVAPVTANTAGQYKEYFGLVAESQSWFSDKGLYYPIKVQE